MINNDENDAKEPKGERKAYYDEDQSPCLSLLARIQRREWERGQEDEDQTPCLSLLAKGVRKGVH